MVQQTQSPQAELAWHTQAADAALARLQSQKQGLTEAEATARLEQYGRNELSERRGRSPLLMLVEQFTSTMVLILIAAAVISGLLGKPLEAVAISAIVVLFAVLGFVQEYRAERAVAALKQLAVPQVRVRRGGELVERPAHSLAPGDVVLLEAGSIVPADLRLLEAASLRVQEAALTGEAEPIDKLTDPLAEESLPLGDRVNMAFMGTMVTYGRGSGVVVATGMQTQLGRIAELLQDVDQQRTPLQEQLDQVGKLLAAFGVGVALLVLLVGVLRGETVNEMFLTAVSVAVAVVPEGLPAVVTVTLALGAQRMLRQRALIRKLPAVETLGAVTVICSDKTGTLTENRMTVTVIDVAGHYLELVGTARHPAPALVEGGADLSLLTHQIAPVALTLVSGALCNDASLRPDPETGRYLAVGDPTEGALLVAAKQAGLEPDALNALLPRVAELPFDSDRKRMTTVHRLPADVETLPPALRPLDNGQHGYIAITKGAVDSLLTMTRCVWDGDTTIPLDEAWRGRIETANDQMAMQGKRVLGVAVRWLDAPPRTPGPELESEAIFVGMIGMIDPPRPEVKAAVETSLMAGIRPIMITGDHPLTARFIATDLGISTNGRVKTGENLDSLSEAELDDVVDAVSVFARVTPEHKLRIVETLQKKGYTVAMTGDGVNDSPALKKADIGIAMGITGTDVSKEASQMVLLDDNFATIVAAVKEGRSIYDNIRRFVKFSVAGNLGKVIVMLFAPLFGIPVALLPLQLLWLNLLTDGLLGLGLGMEPAEADTMQRQPRRRDEGFFSGGLRAHILRVGLIVGVVALGVGVWFHDPANLADTRWQTMIFTTLAFLQIGQALASRSTHAPLVTIGLRSNPALLTLAGVTLVLQLAVIYTPFLQRFFQVTPLSLAELALAAALGSLALVAIEIEKRLLPPAA